MKRRHTRAGFGSGFVAALTVAAIVLAGGCGGEAGTSMAGAGVAIAEVADWQWRIEGTCEWAGDDMTFTAPGDPLLSIGFNPAGTPGVVGNLSSQSEGFVSFIGHPDVPAPTVSIEGNVYSVSGEFFVAAGISVNGQITVTCR